MIARILSLSVRGRWFIAFLTAIVAAYGAYQVTKLPLDALPDITNKQAMVNFAAPAFGPEEVEKRITLPMEVGLASMRGLERLNTTSLYGLSDIKCKFSYDI